MIRFTFDISKIVLEGIGGFMMGHIVQMQMLGYKKIAGEIPGCQENALAKSFEISPHMI